MTHIWRVDTNAHDTGAIEQQLLPLRAEAVQMMRYGIRVKDHYRLTFRWENGHAYEVCVEDYH